MSIASDLIRGNTDMIILAQLMNKESYGYEINKKIQEKSKKKFELKEATLYGAFRRLEEAGYVSFYWGDEQTGARRRYYSITVSGREAFERMLEEWREAGKLIEALIVNDEGEEKND
jgi:DNA-binding PadR family transcriptional regulator